MQSRKKGIVMVHFFKNSQMPYLLYGKSAKILEGTITTGGFCVFC